MPGRAVVNLCTGSGQQTDRVHASGAIVCPVCHGAYLSSGFTLPEHEQGEIDPFHSTYSASDGGHW